MNYVFMLEQSLTPDDEIDYYTSTVIGVFESVEAAKRHAQELWNLRRIDENDVLTWNDYTNSKEEVMASDAVTPTIFTGMEVQYTIKGYYAGAIGIDEVSQITAPKEKAI